MVARVPARGARSAWRLSLGRPRAPARVRLPSSDRRRGGSDLELLAPYRSLAVSYLFASEYQGQPW